MSEEQSPLSDFAGVARLFPLPNLVFFPQVMQPLHIFEPRYRQMTADALAGDRLIALALPRPGWEPEYARSPALYSVACLGTIVAEQSLEDGGYNILVRGLSRVQIVHETPHCKLYRLAKVELLAEVPITSKKAERALRKELTAKIAGWVPGQQAILNQFKKLLRSKMPLGPLCDILSFALPLDADFKQSLLEELEVFQRTRRLLDHLEKMCVVATGDGSARKFPPEFSLN